MTALENTTLGGHHGYDGHGHKKMDAAVDQDRRSYSRVPKAGRFLLHFLEMLLAMFAGMGIFHLLAGLIPASSSLAAINDSETLLHNIAMDVFMTVPMLAWMVVRGHGWRHAFEMGVAMLAPIAVINLLCSLGLDGTLPWLAEASGPAMFLGMIVAMLYRRDHYTGRAGHFSHSH